MWYSVQNGFLHIPSGNQIFVGTPKSRTCLSVKSGGTENFLDVLSQYAISEFCRLGLNRRKLYRSKTWYILTAHDGKRPVSALASYTVAGPSSLKLPSSLWRASPDRSPDKQIVIKFNWMEEPPWNRQTEFCGDYRWKVRTQRLIWSILAEFLSRNPEGRHLITLHKKMTAPLFICWAL